MKIQIFVLKPNTLGFGLLKIFSQNGFGESAKFRKPNELGYLPKAAYVIRPTHSLKKKKT